MRPRLEKGGLVDQQAPNKAYDAVKFVEEHYEEIRQWYLDIMERITYLETLIEETPSTPPDSSDTDTPTEDTPDDTSEDTPITDQEGNEDGL